MIILETLEEFEGTHGAAKSLHVRANYNGSTKKLCVDYDPEPIVVATRAAKQLREWGVLVILPDEAFSSKRMAKLLGCSEWTVTRCARGGLLFREEGEEGFVYRVGFPITRASVSGKDRKRVLRWAMLRREHTQEQVETLHPAARPISEIGLVPGDTMTPAQIVALRALLRIVRTQEHRIATAVPIAKVAYTDATLITFCVRSHRFIDSVGRETITEVELVVPDSDSLERDLQLSYIRRCCLLAVDRMMSNRLAVGLTVDVSWEDVVGEVDRLVELWVDEELPCDEDEQ